MLKYPWQIISACVILSRCTHSLSSTNYFLSLELEALKDLYDSTNGENWYVQSSVAWNFDETNPNPCLEGWIGIVCSNNCTSIPCNVLELNLNAKGLLGTLPPTVGNFSKLTTLSVGANDIGGQLPNTINQLTNLQVLVAYYNDFTGTLPSMNSLSQLEKLDISNNQFHETFPLTLQHCLQLKTLNLMSNSFYGTIPEVIGKLRELEDLELDNNYFSSSLPSQLNQLTKLQYFYVDNNVFMGSFPQGLTNATNLSVLSLYNNLFVGTLPHTLTQLTSLTTLHINKNLFSGPLPTSFGSNCSLLQNVYLSDNRFTGPVPDSIAEMTAIQNFVLQNNAFHGTLPSKLGQLVTMKMLLIGNNAFTGAIPATVNNMYNLQNVELSNNYFTGNIDNCDNNLFCFTGLGNMSVFHLQDNYVFGNNGIVGQMVNSLINLIDLNISQNVFSGPMTAIITAPTTIKNAIVSTSFVTLNSSFSSSFALSKINDRVVSPPPMGVRIHSELYNLTILDISKNYFTGTIDASFFQTLPTLLAIDLANNSFSGPLDGLFANNRDLSTLDISSNEFSGTIPSDLFTSEHLLSFAAIANCLTGSLPVDSICQHKQLQTLILDGLYTAKKCQEPYLPSFPSITSYRLKVQIPGELPICLFNMTSLQTLHLSGNAISGSIPSDIVIAQNLTSLILSYNHLTGSIPDAIQLKTNWNSLDLSFNKISGVLQSGFAPPVEDNRSGSLSPSLKLKVNRLSGDIPNSLMNVKDIDILQGNLFHCEKTDTLGFHRSLPTSDEYAQTYECGTDSINTAIYIWITFVGLLSVIICVACIIWNNGQSTTESHKEILKTLHMHINNWYQVYLIVQDETNLQVKNMNQVLFQFGQNLSAIRSMIYKAIGYTIILLLPLYSVLTLYYSTHAYSYAWRVSLAYLCGIVPAIVVLVFAGIFQVCIFTYRNVASASSVCANVATINKSQNVQNVITNPLYVTNENQLSNNEERDGNCEQETTQPQQLSSNDKNLQNESSNLLSSQFKLQVEKGLMCCGIILCNCVVVLVVNIGYVYLTTLELTQGELFLIEVICSLFKICWGRFIVLGMFANVLHNQMRSEREENIARINSWNISFLVYLVIFNNILAPFLAEAFIDPNCFYYMIRSQSPVDVTYKQYYCTQFFSIVYTAHKTVILCGRYDTNLVNTSYIPPFSYSFQCSSSLLNGFVIVFLYRYIMTGILLPVGKICFHYVRVVYSLDERITQCDNKLVHWIINYFPSSFEQSSFDPEKFVVTLIGDLAVLLTFGFTFPPLAIVIGCAIIVNTFYHQLYIGRLAFNATKATDTAETQINQLRLLINEDEENVNANVNQEKKKISSLDVDIIVSTTSEDFNSTALQKNSLKSPQTSCDMVLQRIHNDCRVSIHEKEVETNAHLLELILQNVPLITTLSGAFLGLFLFDILGSEVGTDAYWIIIVSFAIPILIWMADYLYNKYIHVKKF